MLSTPNGLLFNLDEVKTTTTSPSTTLYKYSIVIAGLDSEINI